MSLELLGALMLAALSAEGETAIEEPLPTRDHTERAFPLFGLEAIVAGQVVRVPGGQNATAPPAPVGRGRCGVIHGRHRRPGGSTGHKGMPI